MQEPTLPEFHYASFMVRIWLQVNGTVEGDTHTWMGEIEHLQSGNREWFETLDEVPDLLRRQAQAVEPG